MIITWSCSFLSFFFFLVCFINLDFQGLSITRSVNLVNSHDSHLWTVTLFKWYKFFSRFFLVRWLFWMLGQIRKKLSTALWKDKWALSQCALRNNHICHCDILMGIHRKAILSKYMTKFEQLYPFPISILHFLLEMNYQMSCKPL